YGVYHDLQADGFLQGTLSIPVQPDPQLVHAKDPYDSVNIRYWWLDASYYKGKYYIYWGPVPALLQAAAKGLFSIKTALGDQYLTLFFLCVAALAGALLIERLARRLFPGTPRWLVALGVLAFAFANPTPHGATTASTYHTAIMAGQAFIVAGVLAAFDAVWHANTPKARPQLLWAGFFWALAIGSRASLLFAVACLIAVTAGIESAASTQRFRRLVADSLWLGVPVAAMGAALLTYNRLRFDHFLEFGSSIQLSGMPRIRFSLDYVPINTYSYTLGSWFASCQFPYLFQVWNPTLDFPRFLLPPPAGYLSPEPVVGFLVGVPLTWLIPFAFVLVPRPLGLRTRRARAYLFCLLSFGVLASVTGIVVLGVYGSTMRYLSDITYGLVLLALLAGFGLRAHPLARHVPRLTSALVGTLALASVTIGLLLGYQGYNEHFHRQNPKLDRTLVKALSFCGGRPAPLPGGMHDAP
ncbi:MAG TPA: hypothetical protein VGQ57_04120, partial [Polyangiaceae bacterium]|nr:hypothetical protein [Polyangiaceae bacterium]